jgi:acyl-CoA reductase-like NAD-dependent aldehyde dehydrogenase
MGYSGQSNMKRVSLECGGKTPHIILRDCPNLDAAAQAVASGIFFNQGEVCNAGSRLLVEEPIREALLEKVIAISAGYMPGDPLDPATTMGAIVSKPQMERVLEYIDSGKNDGAALVRGGKRVRVESGGFFVEPTVFDRVRNDMRIAREEIFGPVLSVVSCASAEEAVKIANDTIYGLAAAIWTSNIDTALSFRSAGSSNPASVGISPFTQSKSIPISRRHGSRSIPCRRRTACPIKRVP